MAKTNTSFRNNGAIGALLDEYERSISNLIETFSSVNDADLSQIIDRETDDEDCRSIQTILTHVVRAGYGYATYIRRHQGDNISFITVIILPLGFHYQIMKTLHKLKDQ